MGVPKWFKRKPDVGSEVLARMAKDGVESVEVPCRIVSSEPPVLAPLGKTLRIRNHISKFRYMMLEIVSESGVAVREQAVYGGATDEEVREAFAELVHDYEVEQDVYRKIEEREGEYDQWPPQ